jgi:hypothetical protein
VLDAAQGISSIEHPLDEGIPKTGIMGHLALVLEDFLEEGISFCDDSLIYWLSHMRVQKAT